jgi:hypothetical protein
MVRWTKFDTNQLQGNFFKIGREAPQWLPPLHELQSPLTVNSSQGSSLKGIVYHCSRCGSRALARILSASPQGPVLSEPLKHERIAGLLGKQQTQALQRIYQQLEAQRLSGSSTQV